MSSWLNPIAIVPKRVDPAESTQKVHFDYKALIFLSPVTKAYFKVQGILSLVPLHKMYEYCVSLHR